VGDFVIIRRYFNYSNYVHWLLAVTFCTLNKSNWKLRRLHPYSEVECTTIRV